MTEDPSSDEPEEEKATDESPDAPETSPALAEDLQDKQDNPDDTALTSRSASMSTRVDDDATGRMPFLDHLEELRWRLLKALAAVLVGAVASFIFSDELMGLLTAPYEEAVASLAQGESGLVRTVRSWFGDVEDEVREEPVAPRPLPGGTLQSLKPMTVFFAILQIALIGGVILALPVVFYQFWQFVGPGLLRREKRLMLPIVGLSVFCFAIGALLAYFVVLPLGLRFFLALDPPNVQSHWALDEYIGFVLRLILGFGIVFEMPVVTLFLSRIGLLTPEYLRRVRRYAIIVIFALAAIFTPPDPLSQLLMALPLLALYEVSIWVCKVTRRRKETEAETGD